MNPADTIGDKIATASATASRLQVHARQLETDRDAALEALSTLRTADVASRDAATAAQAEVLEALADYRAARRQSELLGTAMLERAEDNLRLTQEAFEAGKVGSPAITTAQDNLINVRRSYLDALGALILSVGSVLSKIILPGTIIPIGIITSLVGIPFFLFLVLRHKKASW